MVPSKGRSFLSTQTDFAISGTLVAKRVHPFIPFSPPALCWCTAFLFRKKSLFVPLGSFKESESHPPPRALPLSGENNRSLSTVKLCTLFSNMTINAVYKYLTWQWQRLYHSSDHHWDISTTLKYINQIVHLYPNRKCPSVCRHIFWMTTRDLVVQGLKVGLFKNRSETKRLVKALRGLCWSKKASLVHFIHYHERCLFCWLLSQTSSNLEPKFSQCKEVLISYQSLFLRHTISPQWNITTFIHSYILCVIPLVEVIGPINSWQTYRLCCFNNWLLKMLSTAFEIGCWFIMLCHICVGGLVCVCACFCVCMCGRVHVCVSFCVSRCCACHQVYTIDVTSLSVFSLLLLFYPFLSLSLSLSPFFSPRLLIHPKPLNTRSQKSKGRCRSTWPS